MVRILILGFIFLSVEAYCQKNLSKGNLYFASGEYAKADSLFSKSICNFETHDAYYNRAMVRLYMGDTCNACEDFAIMAKKYIDNESILKYHSLCCNRVDTNYFDEKFSISDKQNYKYYEVISWENCTRKIYGTLHNQKIKTTLLSLDASCDRLGGFNEVKTNIIAFFTLLNEQKVYTTLYGYNPVPENDFKLEAVNRQAKRLLNSKYPEFKQKNKSEEITVQISFVINENGMISNPEFIETRPFVNLGEREDEFKQDIIDIINHYPLFKPAKIKNTYVKFRNTSTIVF